MALSMGCTWLILCLSFLGWIICGNFPICSSLVNSTPAVLYTPPLALIEEEAGRQDDSSLTFFKLEINEGMKSCCSQDGLDLQFAPHFEGSVSIIDDGFNSTTNSNPQEAGRFMIQDGYSLADFSSACLSTIISTINHYFFADLCTIDLESIYDSLRGPEESIRVPRSRVLAGYAVHTHHYVSVSAWHGIGFALALICGVWATRTLGRAHDKMVIPKQLKKAKSTAIWTCLLLLLVLSPASALDQGTPQYPSIQLNAGVLHAPPMAVVDGDTSFSGFQIDLLERLQIFAAEDGFDLQFKLSPSPPLHGDALDLIANDCNTTSNPNSLEQCQKFDIIIGDYYSSSERYRRANLSPAWMRSSMATIKYIEKEEGSQDITILAEAEEANATVCVPQGTYLGKVVQARHPKCQYIHCDPSEDECIDLLKNGRCVLYADDELQLIHTASKDESLELTGEAFNNQYFVWPLREDLPNSVSKSIKRWMYRAVENATLDDLYIQYYTQGQCPLGSAGEHCDLPCNPAHGVSDSRGDCICDSAKFTGDDCSIEVQEELNMLPSRVVLTCYVLAGFNYMLVLLSATWLVRNRKRAQVKMAQPMFLMLILVGCLISTSTIFAMAEEDDADGPVPACAAIPWLYSCGFCLTFGALYARISRIYQVINFAVEMKRVTISARETLRTVGVILAIDVVILTVWTIADRLEWQRTITATDVFGESLESQGFCTSEHWKVFAGLIASFHFVLMAVACYRCYLARKIPDKISNGKYVGMAMFSQVQIFCVVLPALAMLGSDDPGTSFLLRSAAIWINDFVVVILIFGNLRYKVLRQDREAEKLKKYNSHIALSTEIRNYAKKVRGISKSLTVRFSSAVSGRVRLGLDSLSKRDSSRRDDSSRKDDSNLSSNFLNRSTGSKSGGKAKKQVRIFEAAAPRKGTIDEESSLHGKEHDFFAESSDVSFHIDDGSNRMPPLEEMDSEGSEDELEGMLGTTPMGRNECVDNAQDLLKVDINQELPQGLQVARDLHEKEKEELEIRAGKIPSIPKLPEVLKNSCLVHPEGMTDSPRNKHGNRGMTATHFDLERQPSPKTRGSNYGMENGFANGPSHLSQVPMRPSDLEKQALPARTSLPYDPIEVLGTASTNPNPSAEVKVSTSDSYPPVYSAKKMLPQDPEAYPLSTPQPDPAWTKERKPPASILKAARPFDPGEGISPSSPLLPDFLTRTSDTPLEIITYTPVPHSPTSGGEEDGIPREILEQAHQTWAVLDEFASWVGDTLSEPPHPLFRRMSDLSAASALPP